MAKDLIFDDDLVIENGDFLVADSDTQHIAHLLLSRPGHYKNVPYAGIAINDFLNSPTTPKVIANLEREIALQLEADGAKSVTVNISKQLEESTIQATYE